MSPFVTGVSLAASGIISVVTTSGIEPLITVVVFLAIAGGAGAAVKAGGVRVIGSTLVLTRFTVSRSPLNELYIDVAGRPQGLVAFLLRLFGLSGDTAFRVGVDRLSIEGSGFSGKFFDVAPLGNVASTHCGFSRNVVSLFLGSAAIIAGIVVASQADSIVPFLIGAAIGGLLLWNFFSSRTMRMAAVTNGGTVLGLKFKQGAIGGLAVDFAKVEEAIQIINYLVANLPTRVSPR